MLIASYNKAAMGDVLVVMTQAPAGVISSQQTEDVVQIVSSKNGVVGYNFLNVSRFIDFSDAAGEVRLSEEQVEKLNDLIKVNGFTELLAPDLEPKFVVGYVETAEPHPDSDHLQITHTTIDNGEQLQIVSGSPNMAAGIKVVVAKPGAMMPSGLIIWPGALRGVESNGMIVSGRELQLPNAPQVPGALILPGDFAEVGTPFDAKSEVAQALFK
jgi:tRNA-binding protein